MLFAMFMSFLLVLVFCVKPAKAASFQESTICADLPRITLVATGGTIAGTAPAAESLTNYTSGVLSAEELISAVPVLNEIAHITCVQFSNMGSENMRLDDVLCLAKRVDVLLQDARCDGVVITHGTDTLEETAYFLHLVLKSEKPVVLVGAMRPSTAISADGPLNLLHAVAVAANATAHGKGVLIVLGGHILSSREGTKSHTLSAETFKAHEIGILGYIVDLKPVFYRNVLRKHTIQTEFFLHAIESLPRVDIFYQYLDVSSHLCKAMVNSGPRAMVIAGMGDGTISQSIESMLQEAAAQGMVIVRSSRVGSGMITPHDSDVRSGFLYSDNLAPQKARILLMLALTVSDDLEKIQKMFMVY